MHDAFIGMHLQVKVSDFSCTAHADVLRCELVVIEKVLRKTSNLTFEDYEHIHEKQHGINALQKKPLQYVFMYTCVLYFAYIYMYSKW